jgi:hypothetical protein
VTSAFHERSDDDRAIVDIRLNCRLDHSGPVADELRNEFDPGLSFRSRDADSLRVGTTVGPFRSRRRKGFPAPAQGPLAGADTEVNSLPG